MATYVYITKQVVKHHKRRVYHEKTIIKRSLQIVIRYHSF